MFSSNDTKLYKTLGVEKNSTEAEIKKAYKKMALKYHPDRNKDPDAEGKFKEIAKSYEILGDSEKRKNYDMFGLDGVNSNPFGGGGGSGGGNPFDVFSDIFGGPSFGNSRSSSKSKTKASDVIKEIEIDIRDIYLESQLKMAMVTNIKCSKCDGLGCIDPNDVVVCKKCDGSGMFVKVQQFGPGMISQTTQMCNECRGKGKTINPANYCNDCGGTKKLRKKIALNLNLKKSHSTGDRIIYEHMADYNPDADVQGNLIVIIKEKPDPNFIRMGDNLIYVKTISLIDALCGMELSIKHFDGRELYCKTSEVIQPNSVMKISGEGMTNSGNMFIKINVIFPTTLSEERKLYIKKLINQPNEVNDDNNDDNNDVDKAKENKYFKFLDTISEIETENVESAIANSKSHTHKETHEDYPDDDGPPQCATQ